ncbi:hypothetical protein Cgig2_007959 [Carnegiea gigantea]|uniref:Uncharacterized protein n=1 Tax=Carnegiea gigantea TaxID=171969 RepID=A0A9Q1KDH2_9CARY|nr:hypothetical protein Cgig2_007959 [Carnegiea gigantea]
MAEAIYDPKFLQVGKLNPFAVTTMVAARAYVSGVLPTQSSSLSAKFTMISNLPLSMYNATLLLRMDRRSNDLEDEKNFHLTLQAAVFQLLQASSSESPGVYKLRNSLRGRDASGGSACPLTLYATELLQLQPLHTASAHLGACISIKKHGFNHGLCICKAFYVGFGICSKKDFFHCRREQLLPQRLDNISGQGFKGHSRQKLLPDFDIAVENSQVSWVRHLGSSSDCPMDQAYFRVSPAQGTNSATP